MQEHWLRWGPPVYIPVAGYFGLNRTGRRQRGEPPPSDGIVEGDSHHPAPPRGGRPLEELVDLFQGGLIA